METSILFTVQKKILKNGLKTNSKKAVDHYYPLSRDGEHLIENIILACPHCNMSKHDKDLIEFANKLGRLTQDAP